jgi:Na+/phosphate symporter
MRIQVAELLLEMIDYLNRNGCEGPEIPKEAQNVSQIDHEIEEYVSDIKRLFTDKLKEDPATRKDNPEIVWKSMEPIVRKNVDKLLQKKAKIAVVE